MAPSIGGRTILAVAVLFALAGSGLWLLADGQTANARDAAAVSSCTEITEPGRYVLTDDVGGDASTCVTIRSSDVVFEGRGHAIEGDGSFGTAGLVVRSPSDRPIENVTIRNLSVANWDDGIRLIGVEGSVVSGTLARDNRVGISLLDAHGNKIAENVVSTNRLRGISLLERATNNTIASNTARDNALFGIHLVDAGVRNNTLRGNDASNNEFGIVLVGAHGNVLTDNAANSNRIAGIWLTAARDNRIVRNDLTNRFYGVYLADRSNRNSIDDNTVVGNPVGIRLRSSDLNVVTENEIRSSDDNAILLIASDSNVVVGNAGSDNARGVTVLRSGNNTVEDNDLEG